MDAIKYLKADRIGHGIKIIENPSILDNVVNAGIPFEICVFKQHQKWRRKKA